MFNKDFYPTPEEVIYQMGIDCSGKIVLEPQRGKGDIVKWLYAAGAKEVLTCELNKDLAKIMHPQERFICNDFLSVRPEQISHVQLIVMNPPFSKGTKHLLHAWDIAPAGCEIISLFNNDTLQHAYERNERQLKRIIEENGTSQSLGNCFKWAERKTEVDVALIKLYKPAEGANEFNGFFMDEEPEEQQGNGIMKYNAVRDIVQRYIESVKCYDQCVIQNERLNQLNSPFGVGGFTLELQHNQTCYSREDYKKGLQKAAWQHLFDKMNLKKYVTSQVMKDINKFVETQTKVPFTMKNIYHMFEIIVGTREQTFNKSLVEAVDNFTMYTHENRYGVEEWKTNEGHLLNMKFIVPYMVQPCSFRSRGISMRSSNNVEYMQDMVKVLCALTGTNYDNIINLHYCVQEEYQLYDGLKCIGHERDHQVANTKKKEYEKEHLRPVEIKHNPVEFGKWADWAFFKIKPYMKGTLHVQFKDENVWAILNNKYASIKGAVLPEKIKVKNKNKAAYV